MSFSGSPRVEEADDDEVDEDDDEERV